MAKVTVLRGVSEEYAQRLEAAGVRSVAELLRACARRKDRERLAGQCGIPGALLLKWTHYADLMRIRGVGGEYAELLAAAAVESVPELARRSPEQLTARLEAVNAEHDLVRRVPVLLQVRSWVRQAGELPRAVE